jgi:hypothetical protein
VKNWQNSLDDPVSFTQTKMLAQKQSKRSILTGENGPQNADI